MSIKRRDFLKGTAAAGIALAGLPMINNLGVQALAKSPGIDALSRLAADNDRILVLVQLSGGNDGLNTLVPWQDSKYYAARPGIALNESQTLPLSDSLRWHSALSGFRDLYENENLAIIQNTTYPNPNRSHFRGTDIWLTATDSDVFFGAGWLGRYLTSVFPDYPETLPTHPMAIQIGGSPSLGFSTSLGNTALAFRTPEEFSAIVNGKATGYPDAPDTPMGEELSFLRNVAASSQIYADTIDEVYGKGKDLSTVEYPDTALARALNAVAGLIAGGLQTKVYLVSLGGFDTHASQLGQHNNLLSTVGDAVKAFMDDVNAIGVGDRVAGMTFSEFGRRVNQNGSAGTDHGTAAPMFVFGNKVLGKTVHGNTPNLDDLDNRGDIRMEHDFREVYASVLAQWFGESDGLVSKVLFREFNTLPLFEKPVVSSVEDQLERDIAPMIYPNPAVSQATLAFNLPQRSTVEVSILDVQGRTLARVHNGELAAGRHSLALNVSGFSSGLYLTRLRVGGYEMMRALNVAR